MAEKLCADLRVQSPFFPTYPDRHRFQARQLSTASAGLVRYPDTWRETGRKIATALDVVERGSDGP